MSKYSVFISGETIDLCVPSKIAIEVDNWANWFNDPVVCENIYRGEFPHYEAEQYKYLDSLDDKSRVVLMIKPKKLDNVIGVISLSAIEFPRRSAQISIIIGERSVTGNLFSLEAMALVTEHGFEKLGLDRIWAGQAFPELVHWTKYLEIIGYRTEGISRNSFVKGKRVGDIVNIACLYPNYLKLKNERNGAIWSGVMDIKKNIKKLPKQSYADKYNEMVLNLESDYFCMKD